MAKNVTIKQGDTRPHLRWTPTADGGRISDPGVKGYFTMSRNGQPVVTRAECEVQGSDLIYKWRPEDTARVGVMQGEFLIVYDDGGTETDPVSGYIQITVEASLSPLAILPPPDPDTGPANTALPIITGTARGGETLTGTAGTWTGKPVPTLTSAMERQLGTSGEITVAASGLSVVAVEGFRYRTMVSASNGVGGAVVAVSAWTAVASAAFAAPQNTTAPAISDNAVDGETMTGTEGSWSGNPAPTLAAVIQRQLGTAGPVETAAEGLSVEAVEGYRYRTQVTGSNGVGSPVVATSPWSAVVAAVTPEPEPSVALNMTQMDTPYRVTQRRALTGGGEGMGQGTLTVAVNPSEATPIFARTRDADSGDVMQAPWQVNASQAPGAATLTIPDVDVQPNWIFLDLAPSASGPWSLGTTPRAVGAKTLSGSQSQGIAFVAGVWGDMVPMASVGVTPPAKAACFFRHGGNTYPWARMVNASGDGTFFGAGAAEFLRLESDRHGCVCALVGAGGSGTELTYFLPGRSGADFDMAVIDDGFEQVMWHQGGEDANDSRTQAQVFADMTAILDRYIPMKGAFTGTPKIVATAMATRAGTGNTAAQVIEVRRGMKQAVDAKGGLYIEPRDVELNDDVHQKQAGSVVLAGHYERAFAGTYDPPRMVSGAREGAVITIACDQPITVKGNMNPRMAVFPAGTQTGRLDVSSITANGSNLVITLAADPGGSTALEVWAYFHPDVREANLYGIYGPDGVQHLEPSLEAPISIAGGALAKPTSTGAPTLTGTFVVGEPITFAPGPWNDEPSSYRYLLERSAPSDTGTWEAVTTTGTSYTPVAGDDARWFRLTAWATNGAGESDPAVSINHGPARLTSPLIADDFSGMPSNGSMTGRVAPTGQTWTIAPNYTVSFRQASTTGRIIVAGVNGCIVISDPDLPADCYVEADMFTRTRRQDGLVGLNLRHQADGSHYRLRKRYVSTAIHLTISHVDPAGAVTDIATHTWTDFTSDNQSWRVRFEAEGSTLRLFVNGTLRTSGTDGRIAGAGGVGFWADNGTDTTREQPNAIRAGAL